MYFQETELVELNPCLFGWVEARGKEEVGDDSVFGTSGFFIDMPIWQEEALRKEEQHLCQEGGLCAPKRQILVGSWSC